MVSLFFGERGGGGERVERQSERAKKKSTDCTHSLALKWVVWQQRVDGKWIRIDATGMRLSEKTAMWMESLLCWMIRFIFVSMLKVEN